MDYAGIAAVITAAGVLVAAVAGAYVTIRTTKKVAEVHETVGVTATKIAQIDRAVNGKPPGGTTMVSQVQDLHDQIPEDGLLPMVKRLVADVDELKKQIAR